MPPSPAGFSFSCCTCFEELNATQALFLSCGHFLCRRCTDAVPGRDAACPTCLEAASTCLLERGRGVPDNIQVYFSPGERALQTAVASAIDVYKFQLGHYEETIRGLRALAQNAEARRRESEEKSRGFYAEAQRLKEENARLVRDARDLKSRIAEVEQQSRDAIARHAAAAAAAGGGGPAQSSRVFRPVNVQSIQPGSAHRFSLPAQPQPQGTPKRPASIAVPHSYGTPAPKRPAPGYGTPAPTRPETLHVPQAAGGSRTPSPGRAYSHPHAQPPHAQRNDRDRTWGGTPAPSSGFDFAAPPAPARGAWPHEDENSRGGGGGGGGGGGILESSSPAHTPTTPRIDSRCSGPEGAPPLPPPITYPRRALNSDPPAGGGGLNFGAATPSRPASSLYPPPPATPQERPPSRPLSARPPGAPDPFALLRAQR
eukprot:tig00020510_g9897.t1